jgi:hypothetical protein
MRIGLLPLGATVGGLPWFRVPERYTKPQITVPIMPDEETKARYLRRAAELRRLAARIDDPDKRDRYVAAAEAYEGLAGWNPIEPTKRK